MSAEAAKKEAPAPAKKDGAANVQPIKPKGKGKLLMIVAAVVVLGAGAGTWFAFKPSAKPAEAKAAEAKAADAPAEKSSASKAPAIYFKFDPPFVVNFGGEGSARYLQVTAEAMGRDQAVMDDLKNDEPAVRNDLVLLFSSQDNATLMTVDGKEKLRAATLDTIRKVMNEQGSKGSAVEAVYFTSFVIQ